ncbi:MAG TPA: HEAT repeat domain-containing protein [Chthoniobacteraceae bacterium]|nr:HEAT repeat domain-containing protein [Chthoniobacteraceae bacterium]
MKTTPAVFASLALLTAASAAPLRAADKATPAKNSIDQKQIEVALIPEKETILPGEPIFVTFVVRNKTGQELGVYLGDGFYYDSPINPGSYFNFKITDADGKKVPVIQGHGPGISVSSDPVLCKFSKEGEYQTPLFLPVWVKLDKPGVYTITVTKTVSISRLIAGEKLPFFDDEKALMTKDMTATAMVKVLPDNPQQMGELIDALGAKAVADASGTVLKQEDKDMNEQDRERGGLKADYALGKVRKLAEIHDERTIPWLQRLAIESADYSARRTALETLAKNDSDAAFNALKAALETPADKIGTGVQPWGDPKTPAPSVAEAFRAEVIWAICLSKNPAAVEFGLTFRHDPDLAVRRWVETMALLRLKPEEALPVLLEFEKDSNESIREEAKPGLYRACEQLKPGVAIPVLRDLAKDKNQQLAADAKQELAEKLDEEAKKKN